jgi:hypothetical protein
MTRQFFVGGNFKMNPTTREAKRALVKILNEATLDPQTGEQSLSQPHLLGPMTTIDSDHRGCHRTPGPIFDPHSRPCAQGRQGCGAELPL